MNKSIVITIALSMAANIANSQTTPDPFEQVRDALEGVSVPSLITQENMEDVVVPYVTENPPEASLNSATIENEIDQRIVNPDDIGGTTYNNLRDGATLRPEFELSREDPLNLRSESIMENAPTSSVGALFTSTGSGICEESTWEGQPLIEVYCERSSSFEERSCIDERVITLDREDTWECHQIPGTILRQCVQRAVVTCEAPTDCLKRGINFTISSPELNLPIDQWPNRSNAYFRPPQVGYNFNQTNTTASIIEYAPYGPGYLQFPVAHHAVTINITQADWVHLDVLTLKVISLTNGNSGGDSRYTKSGVPTVVINGHTLLSAPIKPDFGSRFFDFQYFMNGYFYEDSTFNILPYLNADGSAVIQMSKDYALTFSAKLEFNYEGHCCENPVVTYEDISCE